jgi:formylglycine-generating enzyme required for sulfatase activity
MLALEGKKHVVKILDFGLAKATSEKRVDGALTKSGQMLGTPDYIAPEQTLDAPGADIRADLYSLGCTLYFLLSGKPPFTGNSLYEILHAHHAVTATPLDQLRPEVPAALAQVVARMMAKQPADRYQTPLDAAKALGPFFKAGAAPPPLPAEQPAVVPQAAPAAMPLTPFAPRLETAPSPFATSEGAAPAPLLNSAPPIVAATPTYPQPTYAPPPFPPPTSAPSTSMPPVRAKAARKPPRKKGPGLLIAAAAGGCLLCLGIWLIVRDNAGNETASVQVPDGGKVELQVPLPTPSTTSVLITPPPPVAATPQLRPTVASSTASTSSARPLGSTGPSRPPATASAAQLASSSPSAPRIFAATSPTPPAAVAPFDAAQARAHQEAWAKHFGTEVEITNSPGMKMVLIPPGEFLMGTSASQGTQAESVPYNSDSIIMAREVISKEQPQHRVVLTRPFRMAATEVTLGQFKKFVAATGHVTDVEKLAEMAPPADQRNYRYRTYLTANPAASDDDPAQAVSFNDASAFCEWLSTQDGTKYRLPTEAEWEYACRAGTTTLYSFGDDHSRLSEYGWFSVPNLPSVVKGTGRLKPNPFALFDMHGGVAEWCIDGYDKYGDAQLTDPIVAAAGRPHVLRGGMFTVRAGLCRSAARTYSLPNMSDYRMGFRCVCEMSTTPTTGSGIATTPTTAVTSTTSPAPAATAGPSTTAVRSTGPVARQAVAMSGVSQPPRAATKPPPIGVVPYNANQARALQQSWARYLGATVEVRNSKETVFVLIPPATFKIGLESLLTTTAPGNRSSAAMPVYPPTPVTVAYPFFLAKTELTVGQFKQFVDATAYETDAEKINSGRRVGGTTMWAEYNGYSWKSPAHPSSDNHPVQYLSHNDVAIYCNWLSDEEGLSQAYRLAGNVWEVVDDATGYRLPHSEEWECAARGGSASEYYFGDKQFYDRFEWPGNSGEKKPVGLKLPNPYGLFDLYGNISEQTERHYLPPTITSASRWRVGRGSNSWLYAGGTQRVETFPGGYISPLIGFRLFRPAALPASGASP